ncbi:MAG: CoA-binding protein [Chloroflexota bacterium]|nr:CoA-binding protein [Chloroflexota bacterium]
MSSNLECFLNPKSIAIIGASATPGAVGYTFISNLIDLNFPGSIFPVHPRLEEVREVKVYPSVESIPEPVDLAMMALQPSRVSDVVKECGRKGIKAIIVAAPGFSDVGEEGRKLERKIVEVAREYGIRIVGPNTQGLINIDGSSVVLSIPLRTKLRGGKGVSFICQTGFFYWDWISRSPHVGLSKAIDLGNVCDVNHAETLEYLGDDTETKVVALHIEGIQNGQQFMKIAEKVTKKKPVVALKAGRTEKGAKAIASHTGALVGNDAVYDAVFRQVGIVRALDTNEMVDFARAFACLSSLPVGNRIAVVTFSGAGGSLAADACDEFGLELAKLSDSTKQKMRKIFPPWGSVGNPIDVLQVVKTDDMKAAYAAALEALSSDPNVDAVLAIVMMGELVIEFDALDVLLEYANNTSRKPTVVCPLRFDGFDRAHQLDLHGFATFPTVRRAVKALAVTHARHEYLCSIQDDAD